jgi:hypothetical protein
MQSVMSSLRVAAVQALGSLLLLVLLVTTVDLRTDTPAAVDVLFAGCCDESICSKYALENCKKTTGGGRKDGSLHSSISSLENWRGDDVGGGHDAHRQQQPEIDYPGALKAAKALGLTRDNRRADAKVMSQSLRSLMAKHSGTLHSQRRRRGGRVGKLVMMAIMTMVAQHLIQSSSTPIPTPLRCTRSQ